MIAASVRTPAFLLSLPRSGSTLLSVMLDRHPAIASPPEPWILLALEALGRMESRHPAHAHLVEEAVTAFLDKSAVRAAADALYAHALHGTGKRLFVDKTPRYHLILDYIAGLYPEAPMVWLRRNPFDTAASYRTTWDIDLPALLRAEADDPYVFDLVLGLDALERFHTTRPDQILAVTYEDLVTDTPAVLERVLSHYGLTDGGALAALMDLRELHRDPRRFGDPKIFATTAPHGRSVGQWTRVLSLDDVQAVLDSVGSARLRRLGYGSAVEEALALGVEDKGPAVTEAHVARCRGQIARRWSAGRPPRPLRLPPAS